MQSVAHRFCGTNEFSASSQSVESWNRLYYSNFKAKQTTSFRLNRMTSMEREEKEKVKKREKKLEDEETLQQATWVKYTFPIKHQVYHPFSPSICSFSNFPTIIICNLESSLGACTIFSFLPLFLCYV